MTKTNEWVCAWCDVDNRVPCEMRDENGVVFQRSQTATQPDLACESMTPGGQRAGAVR
jgi:hypothetical protein